MVFLMPSGVGAVKTMTSGTGESSAVSPELPVVPQARLWLCCGERPWSPLQPALGLLCLIQPGWGQASLAVVAPWE